METTINFIKQAKKIPYKDRVNYLFSLRETEIHQVLRSLFERMEDKDRVEITHAADEYGRDLVIKHENAWGERYVGVVVKKGNRIDKITADSSKIIDSIIQQTSQALSQPCPLREMFAGVVPISEIRVLFVGHLTSRATWRVENEVKKAFVRVYSIGWLVDKFTDNYPEVFFQGKLAEFLQERAAILEAKRDFPIQPALSIAEGFINPWVMKIESPSEFQDMVVEAFRTKKLPFSELEQIIEAERRILIIGDAGTGKTTALAKIAMDMYEKCVDAITRDSKVKQLDLPILLKANELVSHSLDELIDENLPSEPVRDRVRIKVLLIDGIDEVKEDKRGEIQEQLEAYSEDNKCGLVITSRKVEALKSAIVPFKQYEIMPFELRQAMDFLKRAVKDPDLLRILEEGLKRSDLKIAFTPMALELLIRIATVEREIPASITEIYERYTDIVLGRFDTTRGIESAFEYWVKKKFLSELAWDEFYSKDRLSIPVNDFNQYVDDYKEHYKNINNDLDRFLVELKRSGVIHIDDQVYFHHRSFLEYFNSFRLALYRGDYSDLNQDVADIYFDLMWTEVAFYYVGILRQISEPLLKALDEYGESSFEIKMLKLLLGRLLQAGWDTPSDRKLKVISVALRQTESIRNSLDSLIELQDIPIPRIYADYFVLSLAEYSFGSRILIDEAINLCDGIQSSDEWHSYLSCLLLVWANRNRILPDQLEKLGDKALKALSELELKKKLTIREKFVSLFMLQNIEKEDAKLLRQIRRKMASVRKLYPGEIRKLLPIAGEGISLRIKGRQKPRKKRS